MNVCVCGLCVFITIDGPKFDFSGGSIIQLDDSIGCSFAAIANAAYFTATQEVEAKTAAIAAFEVYLHHSFTPGVMPAKSLRPAKGIGTFNVCACIIDRCASGDRD